MSAVGINRSESWAVTSKRGDGSATLGEALTMGEYFKPMRRKSGMVTLLLACVAMGGWIRSSTIHDTFTMGLGSSVQLKLVSVSRRLAVVLIEGDQDLSASFWMSQVASADGWDLNFLFSDSSRAIVGSSITSDLYSFASASIGFNSLSCAVNWCQFSYGAIAIPLTLISAYLLLSKPRSSSQKTVLS